MSSTWTKAHTTEDELSWWREVYVAALQGGDILVAAEEIADAAVLQLRERKQRLKEENNDA